MYKEIIEKTKQEFHKVIDYLAKELAKIRTGQASPSLVEDVMVDAFGQQLPLKQLAGISCPERRQILVQPWDKSYVEPIEKALLKSSLGTSPVVDKDAVRVNLPPLTQEYRKSLEKILLEKAEGAKQTMRKWREEAWTEVQAKMREGKIREDDKFRAKEDLQKLIDEYGTKVDELVQKKRGEIEVG